MHSLLLEKLVLIVIGRHGLHSKALFWNVLDMGSIPFSVSIFTLAGSCTLLCADFQGKVISISCLITLIFEIIKHLSKIHWIGGYFL